MSPTRKPQDVPILQEARQALLAGRFDQCRRLCEKVASRWGDDGDFTLMYGRALANLNQFAPAERILRRACEFNPSSYRPWYHLAMMYRRKEDIDSALAAVSRASSAEPKNGFVMALLAELHLLRGEKKEAYAAIEPEVVRAQADSDAGGPVMHTSVAAIYAQLAGSLKAVPQATAALERILHEQQDLSTIDRITLLLQLAPLYEKAGRYEDAFRTATQGHRLRNGRFDAPKVEHDVAQLIHAWTTETVRQFEGLGDPTTQPLFIVGMPRTGTSLVERILGTHPDCEAVGERAEFSRITFEMMNRPHTSLPMLTDPGLLTSKSIRRIAGRYMAMLHSHAANVHAARIIDKNPTNFLHVGFIRAIFPNARFIWCLRDPLDTCISCYFHNFIGQLEFVGNLSHLGLVYRQHDRLLTHWQSVLPPGPPKSVMTIEYSDLIHNTEARVRELLDFMGLPWDPVCLRYYEYRERVTMTASNDQVRQPIYDSSIGRARHYAAHLSHFEKALRGE